MMEWATRPLEERALLNPAFCATILWHSASVRNGTSQPVGYEECFLVLPLVLPASTRESLPSTTTTPIAVWLDAHPIEQRRLVTRSRLLVPFTRAALLFGASRGFFEIVQGSLLADGKWQAKVKRFERGSSAEVRACMQKAEFVSKWFLRTGTTSTVLAQWGVRP